jgi:glucose-6-phosphate dehydrogenase assembly protein OpcA
MAALTSAGAVKASEIVMLTWRRLQLWRAAISSIVAAPEMISSSRARIGVAFSEISAPIAKLRMP